jgi:hypothetical protein
LTAKVVLAAQRAETTDAFEQFGLAGVDASAGLEHDADSHLSHAALGCTKSRPVIQNAQAQDEMRFGYRRKGGNSIR